MSEKWGFLTNHALVLAYIVWHPDSIVREVASGVGITERATLAILRELDEEGIVERHRDGRRNRYSVNFERLSVYRQIGTVALTPRVFVDGIIRALLQTSGYGADGGNGVAPVPPDSGALDPRVGRWGFFTNHALLVLSLAQDNTGTVRELAQSVGVTERAIVAILNQLEAEDIIVRSREGRRNRYAIDFDAIRGFQRWSPGAWQLPRELVDVAVGGLQAMARDGVMPARATAPAST
jgi:DNA-binding MarR family transcriptional regulator